MRCPMLMVAALTLAAAGRAGATPPVGTCVSGTSEVLFSGSVGLAIPDGGDGFESVAAAAVPYLFGGAECSCASDDVQLEIKPTTALPVGLAGSAEVWVGSGCDDAATRNAGVACERVATLDLAAFSTGSTASGPIHLPIPSRALFAPVTHVCPALGSQANSVYLFLASPSGALFGSCTLSLSEKARPPAAPGDVKVTRSADGVAHLGWSLPPSGGEAPLGFQVLCADSRGAATQPGTSPAAMYSVCEEGGTLKRRALPTDGSGGPPTGVPLAWPGTLAAFDPSYVCSPMVGASATAVDVGLPDASESYQLQLVAVDAYGNMTAGSLVSVGAAPVMAPAGPSGGGCALAGRGGATGAMGAMGALLFGLLGAWRARRARNG